MAEESTLLIDIHEKPTFSKGILLSFQHIFAMFGATVLVPILVGLPVSVALFASGLGTLVYQVCTKAKVPVYLGSSFAYIGAMQIAIQQMGGNISASQTGIMITGFTYILIGLLIKIIGTNWIDYLLPLIVIGPMIMVVGLSLSASAVENAGLVLEGDWRVIITALITFLTTALVTTTASGFLKIIPFLIGITIGYLVGVILGIVDFTPVVEAAWLTIPEFSFPFLTRGVFGEYRFYFGPETWALVPLVLVTVSEHIGDHSVMGQVCGRDFFKEPGLTRTLSGDGIATALSAFFGGPANTTYGENTGVIGMTKVGSVFVVRNAAIIAILLSFLGKFTALISTIPPSVLGGMSIVLYGVIASNGLKVMIEDQTDFGKSRNLIIASSMLVTGIGGAVLSIGYHLTFSGTALSAMVGVVLNVILPKDEVRN